MAGSFAGKGKLACSKAFLEADSMCVDALAHLGGTLQPLPLSLAVIEKLVPLLYFPGTRSVVSRNIDGFYSEENRQSLRDCHLTRQP